MFAEKILRDLDGVALIEGEGSLMSAVMQA
jgi:hypothetical protein